MGEDFPKGVRYYWRFLYLDVLGHLAGDFVIAHGALVAALEVDDLERGGPSASR